MKFFAFSIYWHLPILLVTFSLVYSATRHDRWDRILWEAIGWMGRIGSFLLLVGVGLFIASSYPDQWPILAGIAGVVTVVYWYVTGRMARHARANANTAPVPSATPASPSPPA